ncbi:GNAT family N-acetyltransferase [Microcella sp.]|uniref:GNAT family N-acetyltransferase n=1 Tax=Microcella sp. TaxID=1913979 RepID=UPI003F6E6056
MTVSLRQATASDVESLAALHIRTWFETYGHQLPSQFYDDAALEHRRRMWTRALVQEPDSKHRIVVAEDKGLVGFAWSGPTLEDALGVPTERSLYAIYVLASHHGQGIGQRLLDAVIGDGPATLWVARDNPRAHRFYEKNRFIADGVEKPDERVPTFWEMRLVRQE